MIDAELLSEQMKRSRIRNGQLERLMNGEWVVWPVLPLDKLGRDEVKRVLARTVPKRYQP